MGPERDAYLTTGPVIAPFDKITIDGIPMGADAMELFCTDLQRKYDGAEWVLELSRTISTLIRSKDLPLEAHTSGTTGAPKWMDLHRTDLIASANLTAQAFHLGLSDRVLLCLPCAYIAGQMMVVRAMVLGLDLHIIEPRGAVLDNLKTADRFCFAAMVPLQLHRALQEDRARIERQFDTILLGGGPVSDAFVQDLQDVDVRIFQSYGSTETLTHVAIRKLNGSEREIAFRAIGEVSFALDERGCLVLNTPHLSVKRHITNDLVRLIDERHFDWLGRYDNVILSGGKKIFPEQLEQKTAGVIPFAHYFTSFPDDKLGQSVMLVLETDRPADDVLPEVLEKLTAVLHRHELPLRIKSEDVFLRTSSGKIIRDPGSSPE